MNGVWVSAHSQQCSGWNARGPAWATFPCGDAHRHFPGRSHAVARKPCSCYYDCSMRVSRNHRRPVSTRFITHSPHQCGSVGWASSSKAKVCLFPGQGACLGCRFSHRSGYVQADGRSFSLMSMFLSFSLPSLLLSLKINKIFF